MHRAPRLTLTVPTKAARRVIAPFVKLIRKEYRKPIVPENKLFRRHLERKPSLLLKDLTSFLSDNVDLPSLLHESSDVLKVTTHAHGVSLYVVESSTGEIYQSQRYFDIPEPRVRWKVEEGTIVAAHVAARKQLVMIDDILEDERFPMGIGQKDQLTKSVLCVPVITPDRDCIAVIELFKETSQEPFSNEDLKIASLVTGWMGAAIYQNLQRVAVHKKQQLNDYLLELTKVFLEEFVPAEKMINELVMFVRVTLGAERSSFYLLDQESDDLVADVYEKGIEETEDVQKRTKVKLADKEKEVIAKVAKTGLPINIKDAFKDAKHRKDADVRTGFIVRSVLCMPVTGFNSILGVIEVVNKKKGCFMKSDEILFEVFATYFSLVLQYSDMNQQVKKQEKLNTLHMGLLSRQIVPCVHDYNHFMNNLKIKLPTAFGEFRWFIPEELVNEIPLLLYALFRDFCGPDELDTANVAKFILGLRKFERNLPFHNFEHILDFCHCMYNILSRTYQVFTSMEMKALIIAGFGHCAGRGSTTNEFLENFEHDIAQLYPTSYWQNYHNFLVEKLLAQFPIFKGMDQVKYKQFMNEVRECILATDYRNDFRKNSFIQLVQMEKARNFDNKNPEHHRLLKSLILSSCDLASFNKPYMIARKIAENLYREIWSEGEKISQLRPNCILVELFDSNCGDRIAEQQIVIFDMFVLKTVGMLKNFLPNTIDFYTGVVSLRKTWKNIIELRGRKIWKPEDSYRKKRVGNA